MATRQNSGHATRKGSSDGANQESSQSSMPAQFMIKIKDLSSANLKKSFSIYHFRLFCNAIIRLISLFCNVTQISYQEDEGLLPPRRTIIVTDQIFKHFMENKSTDEIANQLYPDLPRAGPRPGPSLGPVRPPAPYPCNVYPNPVFKVSYATKVATRPRPRRVVHKAQFENKSQIYRHVNPLFLLNINRNFPPTRSVPCPFPSRHPVPLPKYEYFLPPNKGFAEDVLNMIMDPMKDTLLIICIKKDQQK